MSKNEKNFTSHSDVTVTYKYFVFSIFGLRLQDKVKIKSENNTVMNKTVVFLCRNGVFLKNVVVGIFQNISLWYTVLQPFCGYKLLYM